jgi:acyl-CoA thioesterase-1
MAGMKHRTAVLLTSACLLVGALETQATGVKIMPFGDSITANGSDPESSYRYWLYHELTDAGFDFEFVGGQYGVGDGTPANPDFNQSYEGGDGWTSGDALDDANSAAGRDPDIVLLDFGSNDIDPANPDWSTATENNLEQIIETFHNHNANVIILLAKPTPFVPNPVATSQQKRGQKSGQSKLVGIVNRVANVERQAGVNVVVVNLFSGFSAKGDTKDGAHPNVRGEQKIAKKFFAALKKVM